MKNNLVKLRQKSKLAQSYVNFYKPTLHGLKKHRILKRLANSKNIAVLPPDKGSETVILNRNSLILFVTVLRSQNHLLNQRYREKNNCNAS